MIAARLRIAAGELRRDGVHENTVKRNLAAYRLILEANRAAWRRVLAAYADPQAPRPDATTLASYFDTCAVRFVQRTRAEGVRP